MSTDDSPLSTDPLSTDDSPLSTDDDSHSPGCLSLVSPVRPARVLAR